MKNSFILCISLFIIELTHAQNLVPNPSFENFTSCPGGFGQLNEHMEDWQEWGLSQEFPSCFNVCEGEWGSSVPQNGVGNQEPVSGVGYAGLTTIGINYPEQQVYIGCSLITPMEIGQTYYVSYYVNRAHFWGDYSTTNQNIGAKFYTDESNPDSNPESFSQEGAHIGSVSLPIDTTNWARVEGWFTADSAYSWIGLGNYFGLLYDSKEMIGTFPTGTTRNYFYIDDVCVSADPAYCADVLSAGKNLSAGMCCWEVYPNPANDMVHFRKHSGFGIYGWSIKDVSGKSIHAGMANSAVYQKNVTDLKSGMYFVTFKNETTGAVQTLKFIKS